MCSSTEDLQREIRELCEAKHAKLFAHYYVPDEVQDIADERDRHRDHRSLWRAVHG